jgi:predicted hotdog family 3-hydroxylacyl-ACP dehydratase
MIPVLPFPPIEDILPHRGSMLMLDRVLSFERNGASAEYVPRSDAWYADTEGNMPAWIGIELMAQTIAAHVGLLKRSEGDQPKLGALLGTRRYISMRPSFAAGEALRICTTMTYLDASGLCAYDCTIAVGDRQVAIATLKVFEPEDFKLLLQASSL